MGLPYGAPPQDASGRPEDPRLGMGMGAHVPVDQSPYAQGGYQQQQQQYDHRARNQQGTRPAAPAPRNMRQPEQDYGARGVRSRQAVPPGRQDGCSGGCGGVRRIDQNSGTDMQAQAAIESLGPDGLRTLLITTLESLYQDRIKPMANYVKGRLKERNSPEVFVKTFVELYGQHPDLFEVQNPMGGDEATIFFHKNPEWFKGWIDIDSPEDPYDEVLWGSLAKFLDGEHTFAGGRYGMARELMQRNLAFLAPYTLGQVCHIVQLSIQHRRLIVYHRKMLKPIQTVLCQLPSEGNGNGAAPEISSEGEEIKDMDDLTLVLFRMLMHHPSGIRLCRMKQMIKHEFSRKLSEMAFQCTKLIELFSQEPLSATFVLDTENDGKSIYVRLGNPDTFSDHIKGVYAMANAAEAKQALQGLQHGVS
ncbi:unnamed protein product [Polarella glacialis]|uniref:HTH OST-type domain-containing protein n=1 Tax=Polarella glacialis TaxID=89957 RepID=A0A813J6M2_POLGL|nr:unnamed protein product [Polarella glacialis]